MTGFIYLPKDAIDDYMNQCIEIMPHGYDAKELLFTVLDAQWDNCYYAWQKWHYFRNNKHKQIEM